MGSQNLDEIFNSETPEDEEEDNNTQHLTPKEVLARLEKGWINEKLSPELLPPLEQEKDAMLQQIKVMGRNIASLDKKDVRTDIHKLELERIKFVVVSYMRVRLFKLQQMSWYYHELEVKRPPHKPTQLIAEEFAFLKSFINRTEEYYKTTILSKLPTPLQKFQVKKFKRVPGMGAHVFFRVNEANVVDFEDAIQQTYQVILGEGEQHIMRYETVSKLVATDEVYLV